MFTCISRFAWRSARTATSSATRKSGRRSTTGRTPTRCWGAGAEELERRAGSGADAGAGADAGVRVATVFFGGGTPSLWEPRELGRVLRGIREALPCVDADELEVTVECNPTSLDEDRARALVDEGVNRLSIGVQSLATSGCGTSAGCTTRRAPSTAVEGGAPGRAARVGGPHLRASRTDAGGVPRRGARARRARAFARVLLPAHHRARHALRRARASAGGCRSPTTARSPRRSSPSTRRSRRVGFGHYEISNYARPGQEARHNLGYWRGDEYLGLGCGAYGFVMAGARAGRALPQRGRPREVRGRRAARRAASRSTPER